jgi:hypothetical protein
MVDTWAAHSEGVDCFEVLRRACASPGKTEIAPFRRCIAGRLQWGYAETRSLSS